jgi:hypothetical protein
MGAWGTAAFDNDDASDWVYELEANGIAAVEGAIAAAIESTQLEQPTDVSAVAAAEVVAAALGRPDDRLRPDILGLANGIAPNVTVAHAQRARAAVERVLVSSEVADLWAESDDNDVWRASVQDLLRRLAS